MFAWGCNWKVSSRWVRKLYNEGTSVTMYNNLVLFWYHSIEERNLQSTTYNPKRISKNEVQLYYKIKTHFSGNALKKSSTVIFKLNKSKIKSSTFSKSIRQQIIAFLILFKNKTSSFVIRPKIVSLWILIKDGGSHSGRGRWKRKKNFKIEI